MRQTDPEVRAGGHAARLLALALLLSYAGPLRAQVEAGAGVVEDPTVVFDDTFGLAGAAPNGAGFDYAIYASRGEVRGENLFHSFSEFWIKAGETAGLLGDGYENVVLRVPHAVATFDGKLESRVAGARVVVLAPEGIVFGDSAVMSVESELILSTADQLFFGDDSFFDSSDETPWFPPEPGTCCMGDPVALGFEAGTTVASIKFGSSKFKPIHAYGAEALIAVAGSIDIHSLADPGTGSSLTSEGGTIYIAATGLAAAKVPLDVDAATDWLDAVGPEAEIQMSGNSTIKTNTGYVGRVALRGGRLVIEGSSKVTAGGDTTGRPAIEATATHSLEVRGGAKLEASNLGTEEALGIAISAPRVVIEGTTSRVASVAGSALRIDAELLEVNGASVTAEGSGGIEIHANEVVLGAHEGQVASIRTKDKVFEDIFDLAAGDIEVWARSLSLRDRAQIRSTSATGAAGNLSFHITDLLEIVGVGLAAENQDSQSAILTRAVNAPAVPDRTGTITIDAGKEETHPSFRLEIADAGVIETLGGGDIVINAGSVEAREAALVVTIPGVNTNAGDVVISTTASLSLENGAQIRSTTEGEWGTGELSITVDDALRISGVTRDADNIPIQAGILARAGDTNRDSSGSAKKIHLEVGSLDIASGGLVSATSFGLGDAGTIVINARGDVSVTGASDGQPSEIAARTYKAGLAGDVTLNARSVLVRDGAGIFASSFAATETNGDIDVTASQDVTLDDALVTTNAYFASGGGDIRIHADGRIIFQRSTVESKVSEEFGSGGNIVIGSAEGPRLFVLQDSDVTATAQKGVGGNIDIRADILLQSADSSFDASSAENVDGSVDVAAPVAQVEGQLDPLPASFLDVRALLLAHCALRHAAGGSSFVIEEGPPPPPSPRGYLASPPRLPASAGSTTSGAPPSIARQLADFGGGCARGTPREHPPRALDTAERRPPSRPQLLALSGID